MFACSMSTHVHVCAVFVAKILQCMKNYLYDFTDQKIDLDFRDRAVARSGVFLFLWTLFV